MLLSMSEPEIKRAEIVETDSPRSTDFTDAGISWPDVYRLYREQIDHEDDLINQRLSLLVASQSFLFSAYAIVLNGAPSVQGSMFAFQHRVIFWSIPFIGTTLCWFISRSVRAAMLSMCHIRDRWNAYCQIGLIPEYAPEMQGEDSTRKLGQMAPRLLPYIFIGIWVILYIICPVAFSLTMHGRFQY